MTNNEKNDCVRDLSTSLNLIQTIISPLQDEAKAKHLDSSVGAALLGIAEVLSRIKDHLSLWKDKRMSANKILGFLNPSSVIDDLRDDARLLSQHSLTTSFALQVANFLAECNKIERSLNPMPGTQSRMLKLQISGVSPRVHKQEPSIYFIRSRV
jgi:hypothetical protein